MIRNTRRLTAWTLVPFLFASALSGGCSINLVIPLGLNGNPGLLNPFGIIQALVTGSLGLAANNSGSNGTGGAGNGGNPGVPPTVL